MFCIEEYILKTIGIKERYAYQTQNDANPIWTGLF